MAGKKLAGWGIAFCLLLAALVWQWQDRAVVTLVTPLDQPNWSALTSDQKTILAPLASEWNAMEAFRRKKWLGVSLRYPDMSQEEQASVQRNMREWARLAPSERKAAREKFKTLQKFPPEDRQAVKQKWAEYSTLPQEKRDSLKKEAAQRPAPKTPTKPPTASPGAPPTTSGANPAVTSRSPLSPLKPLQSPLVPQQVVQKTTPVPAADVPCAEE